MVWHQTNTKRAEETTETGRSNSGKRGQPCLGASRGFYPPERAGAGSKRKKEEAEEEQQQR
jgi:hypothetical protein